MTIADFLFRIRGFTPIPFVVAALIWVEIESVFIIIGLAMAVGGELLRIRSIQFAGGATRTRNVGAPSLITSGPYARVRNPLYTANMLIYTGYALASGALFPYLPIVAFIYFAFQYLMIIKLEENTLIELFGQEYKEYCQQVPKLIPGFISIKRGNDPDLNIRMALKQEKRTLQGFFMVWVLLVLRLFL
ncbi:MAG: isoprenylcysteine carboxylmethyltransferase family protein [Candidatus Hatepunaea meridiana]|nr:isoprenylcysteine carboxylmethyltransferase family protein [Candidatus Hatepunaea meridiana]